MNLRKSTGATTHSVALALLALAAMAAGVAVSLYPRGAGEYEETGARLEQSQTRASVLPAPRQLPDFALLDHDGNPFGRAQLGGRWSLLFFGFTHCPDVCPTTMYEMKKLRERLQDLPAEMRPGIVFVSVDPARDTPEKLSSYLGFFNLGATGLTGTQAQIEQLTSKLGVAVAYSPGATADSYTVDHTAALFAVNPNGELAAIFVPPHDLEHMVADWRIIVTSGET